MPEVINNVTWTTPVFFSGYLATGSICGSIVQAVVITVGTIIYIPFVKISERVQTERERFTANKIIDIYTECQRKGVSCKLLDRNDDVGMLAKSMINSLRTDMVDKNIPMHFQPLVNVNGEMIGAEALLRWKYKGIHIYPPLIITLSQDDGFFTS